MTVALILAYLALPNSFVFASMTSTNYQILWDNVGFGGDDTSSSSSYRLRDAIGSFGVSSSSSSYSEKTGFRGGVYDQTVKFSTFSQDRTSQVAASALASLTVTVTTTASYAVGDRIAIVQNEGASQVVGVGKVTSLTATELTIDALATNGTSPSIDGANDYVYALRSDQPMSLGTLSSSGVSTSIMTWDVNADVTQGYSVYLAENRSLLAASGTGSTIADVSDGTVSAGSSEYGAISSDTSLGLSTFDTQDSAITTTPQQVGSRGDNSFSSRDFVIFKVAVASSQEASSYSNTLSLIFVGDY